MSAAREEGYEKTGPEWCDLCGADREEDCDCSLPESEWCNLCESGYCTCPRVCYLCERPWPEAPCLREYDVREVPFHPGEWQVVESPTGTTYETTPADALQGGEVRRLSWPGPLTYMQAQMLAGACQEAARRALEDNGLLPETKP